MEDKQSTESIKNLIEAIDKKTVALPEFQRDFVWEIGKTYDLFDSLTRDIFIGSIIYGIPTFEVTVRELDNRPRKTEGKKRKKLVAHSYTKEEIQTKIQVNSFRLILDGQQRVTSIYRALKGIDEVWFIVKNEEELSTEQASKTSSEISLEELLYEFSGQQDYYRLSVRLSDVYTMMTHEYFEDEVKTNFFSKSILFKDLNIEEEKEYFRKYLLIINKIKDLLKAEKLISFYLLNMSSEKFALFFERSNSKGTQLSFIDILMAKLYSGFNLRKKTDEFEDLYGSKYKLKQEIIVRFIAYLVSEGRNVDKGYILSNLTFNDFILLGFSLSSI